MYGACDMPRPHQPCVGRYHFGTIIVKSYKSCSYERHGVYSLAHVLTYSLDSPTIYSLTH